MSSRVESHLHGHASRKKKSELDKIIGFFTRRRPPPPSPPPTQQSFEHTATHKRWLRARSHSRSHASVLPTSRKPAPNDTQPLTAFFDAPPSRSLSDSPVPTSGLTSASTTTTTTTTPSNSDSTFTTETSRSGSGKHKCSARTAARHKRGVSFSPSVQFDQCRQRGNIAVPRESSDVEDVAVEAGAPVVPAWKQVVLAAPPLPAPLTIASVSRIDYRPIRALHAFKRATQAEEAEAEERSEAESDNTYHGSIINGSDRSPSPPSSSGEQIASRSLSPVHPFLPASSSSSDDAEYTMGFHTPSPLGLVLRRDSPQPNPQLSAQPAENHAAAATTTTSSIQRERSPDVDVMSLTESLPHELRRADMVCIRAVKPSNDHTPLASRIVFGHPVFESDSHYRWSGVSGAANISDSVKRRSKGRGAEASLGSNARRRMSSGSFADVRDEISSVPASALSLNDKALLQDLRYNADVSGMNLVAMAALAAGKGGGGGLRSRRVNSTNRRSSPRAAGADKESSSPELFFPAPSANRLLEESFKALPAAARREDFVGAAELLGDEDSIAAAASRSRSDAVRSTRPPQSSLPASAISDPSNWSLAADYTYSLPNSSAQKPNSTVPAPPAKGQEAMTGTRTSGERANGVRRLSSANFNDVAFSFDSFSEQPRFRRTGQLDSGRNLADAANSSVPSTSRPRSSPKQHAVDHLPQLILPQTRQPVVSTTPVAAPKFRLAAVGPTQGSSLTVTSATALHSTSCSAISQYTSVGGLTSTASTANMDTGVVTTSSDFFVVPSPRGASQLRMPRRLSELNVPIQQRTAGDGSAPHTVAAESAARTIFPPLSNEEADRCNGAAPHIASKQQTTQLHVLGGQTEALVIHAPVRPNVSLPRRSAVTTIARRYTSGEEDMEQKQREKQQHNHSSSSRSRSHEH
jgi:hypothetical protein